MKKTGEYFLYGAGGGNSKCGVWHGNSGGSGETIRPLTFAQAKEWAEGHLGGEDYERIFGEVVEPEEGTEARRSYSVLLPESILANLQAKKAAVRVPVAELIIKALRDAGY